MQKVEWGEYALGELFEIKSSKKKFDKNKVNIENVGLYPYVVRVGYNNGRRGFLNEDLKYLNHGNTISFGQDTATMFYQETPYFTGDKIKILYPKFSDFKKENAQFFISSMKLAFSNFSWGTSQFNENTLKKQKLLLPIRHGDIDFDFMESFVAELEGQRVAELEAYLSATGLKDTRLTLEEEQVLRDFDKIHWGEFNVEDLFGNSTRGKRLKSTDRIPGTLPFVTAGEASEGVSAFIGNDVRQFSSNTTTVDMFGSAKYRNYPYGGDDHIAVVHTENLPEYAAIFVTTAIHKSAHNGQFDYGRNCYAKDVDALTIFLPITEANTPNYDLMKTIISGIHKLVIQDVVTYSAKKVEATKKAINR